MGGLGSVGKIRSRVSRSRHLASAQEKEVPLSLFLALLGNVPLLAIRYVDFFLPLGKCSFSEPPAWGLERKSARGSLVCREPLARQEGDEGGQGQEGSTGPREGRSFSLGAAGQGRGEVGPEGRWIQTERLSCPLPFRWV